MEWVSDSNQKDACFIVVNSQNESQFSQAYGTPAKQLGKLTALSSDQKCKPGRRENITERHPFSPRNVLSSDMYTTRGRCVKALTASNGNGEPVNQPATGDQQPSGDHHNNNSNHGDGGPAHEGGAVGGAGGGGGDGGDGGGGDHNDDDNADDDGSPHEEEPIEETPPSTSSSSGNSVPQLVRPSASAQSPSIHYPEHSVPHLEHPEMLGEREAVAGTSGVAVAYVAESDSDEEDGGPHSAPPVPADVLETSEAESVVSEATTAVVSDTERYGQFIGERSASSHPSPAPSLSSIASQATQEAPPAELSSAMSTLSSLTSSSSGSEQQPSFRPPKRRLPARRGHTKIKRSRLDTSSTSTSTTDSATTTTTTTTTSDTSPERSRHQFGDRSHDPSTGHSPGPSGDHTRDTSGGQRRDGVGRSHDAPCDQLSDKSGLSQQDMFAEDTPVTESAVGEMLPPDSAPHVHRTTPGDVLEWSHRKRPVDSQTHANSLDPPEDHARSQDHTNQLAAISQDQLTRPRSQDQWTRSQEVTSDGQIKLDGQLAEEQHIPLTPSETLSSLHLSGQPMVVMETLEDDDDDGEPSYVPPSQEAYGLVPSIIPASPTAEIPSSREDEDAGMFHSHHREDNSNVEGCHGNKGDGGSSGSSKDSSRQGSASMSFQQWQPSFLSSQESVSRSSASLTQGCGRGTDKEGGGDNLVSTQDHAPEDHQGHVSQQRGLVDYSGGSSQDLVLHFTQTQGGCSSRPLTKGSQALTVVSRSGLSQQPIRSQAELDSHHSSTEQPVKTASQHDQPIKGEMSKGGQGSITSQPVDDMTPGTGSCDSQSQSRISGFHLSIPKGGSQMEQFTASLTTFDPSQDDKSCHSDNSLPKMKDCLAMERNEKMSDNTTAHDSVEMEDSTGARLNVNPEIRPSLVFDLINADTQQTASQHSCTPTFHLDRPSLEGKADSPEEPKVLSVFQRTLEAKVASQKTMPQSSSSSSDSCIQDPSVLSQSGKLHSTTPMVTSLSTDKRRDKISVTQPHGHHADLGDVHEVEKMSCQPTNYKNNPEKQAADSVAKLHSISEGYDSMTQVYEFTNLRHRLEDDNTRSVSQSAVMDTKSLDASFDIHLNDNGHQDVVMSSRKRECTQREPAVVCEVPSRSVETSRVDVVPLPRTSSPTEMSTLIKERDKGRGVPTCSVLDKQTTVTPPQVAPPYRNESVSDRILRTTTIKTVLCRTITILEERVGGQTVSHTVTDEKLQTLSQDITHTEEMMETPSPSRTAQSMTSGDLADISSISTTPSIPNHNSRLSSRLSKTSSKSSSSSSLPKVSPVGDVSPPGGENRSGSRSDALLRRSSSSLGSVAFSDLMSSTVNLPLRRRSSSLAANLRPSTIATVAMTTNPAATEQKSSEMSKPVEPAFRANHPVAMEMTHDRSQHPSDMDTMIFTDQWLAKESFGPRTAVIGQNVDQPPIVFPRRSSSSLAPSDALFPDDEDVDQKRLSKDSRFSRSTSSSSSLHQAAVSSTDTDHTVTTDMHQRSTEADDHLFSRPGQPVSRRSGHMGQSKYVHVGSLEQEKVVEIPTEGEKADGEREVVDDRSDSPGVPKKGELQPAKVAEVVPSPASKPHSAKTAKVVFETGLAVIAKWKDHNYYPGHVICPGKRAGRYTVAFEDGDVIQVLTSHLIPCDLVRVGQDVFAETSDSWSEPAVVQSHYHDNEGQGYIVKFHNGVEARVPQRGVMLKHHQVETLVAAMAIEAQSASEPAAPSTSVVSDITLPLMEAAPSVGHEKQQPEKTHDGDSLTEEAAKACEYNPPPPQPVSGPLPQGTLVMAMWQDKHYYPGHVTGSHPDGARYMVTFEDGDVLHVAESDMFVCELLGVEQTVFADTVDGWFKRATIIGHYCNHDDGDHDNEHGYIVRFTEDGTTMRLPRSKVNLNSKQAAELLRAFRGWCPTPKSCPRVNVSLDNLVEGKRKTRGTPTVPKTRETPTVSKTRETPTVPKTREKPTVPKTRETPTVPKTQETPTVPKTRETPTVSSSLPRSRRKQPSATKSCKVTSSKKKIPKTTPRTGPRRGRKAKLEGKYEATPSTPAPEEGKGPREESDNDEGIGPLEASYTSPPAKRAKPNKARAALFSNTKGVIPPNGSRIFQGRAFLLTHAEKTEDEKRPVKLPWQHILSGDSCITDESGSEEDAVVPFDKDHLIAQIEAGGGIVLEKFDLDLVQTALQCFLVSDTYQRTLKYLHCLAADVLCISHLWVRDSCNLGALQDDKNYLLPAGVDVETNKVFERNVGMRPLEGLHLMVSSDNVRFKEVWMSVLETAGCHIIHKFPIRSSKSGESSQLDLVVADHHISPSVLHRAKQLHVPLVSAEWIIQCLVCGHIRDSDAHPMYQHDYEVQL